MVATLHPHLRAAVDAGVFLDQRDPFRFGLALSLDGVAAYLESARGGHHDEPHPWTGLDDAGITEDRRVREAKKAVTAVTAAEKPGWRARRLAGHQRVGAVRRSAQLTETLRDARSVERLAAREARERLRRTGQG